MSPGPQHNSNNPNQPTGGNRGGGGGRAGGAGGRPGGPQGRRPRNKTRFGTQMAEKQQLKSVYNISEQQLRNYFKEAHRSRSSTGGLLIQLMEQRLDNIVFRAGLATTRPAARQMVSHGFFAVNGKSTNVASHRIKPNDVVTIKATKRAKGPFANFPKSLQNVQFPSWLLVDGEAYTLKVTSLPTAEEANLGVDIQAIVEFFAR